MKKLIAFLETDETLLRASMLGMLIYAVHNSVIVFSIEHMPFLLKLPFAISAALITEFIALVLFIQGKVWFGRVYATCLYCMGNWYYWYFMPDPKDYSLIMVSWLFNTIHYAASLYLSEIFYHRRQKKEPVPIQSPEPEEENSGVFSPPFAGGYQRPQPQQTSPGVSKTFVQRLTENEEREKQEFTCPHCGDKFSRKFTRDRHIKNFHVEIKESA